MESFTIISVQVLGHLWTVSWQVSVLIGIIWLVDVFTPRASSHLRYWLWCLVLFRLCLPVGTIMNTIERVFPMQSDILFKTTENIANLPVKAMEALPFQSAFAENIPDSIVNIPAALAGGMYIIGLVCFAVIIITTIYRVNRLLYVCEPVERPEVIASFRKHKDGIGLSRNVGLLRMDTHNTKMPAYFGLFRPRIVFSRTIVDDWPAGEYEPVLLHELFHVKRRDLLVNWLQVIIQALYFFHPLVWLANRRIRTLREQVCDDQVLSYMQGGRARYAQSMLRIMEEKSSVICPGFAFVRFSESTNTFRERIERI
ncbi:M56 family metallopeptidase, partial [Candidatus Omnitrophota bacterium]